MNVMNFCTCEEKKCGCNPCNHEEGCNKCIALNLHENCIPRCFFHKLGCKTEEIQTWTFEEFAENVTKKMAK